MSLKLKCKRIGHQKKEILGLCLHEQCTKSSAFCQDCLHPKYGQFHQGHEQYCLEFDNIKHHLLYELDLFIHEIINLQTCHKLLIGLKGKISKIFQIENNYDRTFTEHCRKISKIIVKFYNIKIKIEKRVQEYRLINAKLSSKKFDANELKIKYFPQRKFGLFKKLLEALNQYEFLVLSLEEKIFRIRQKSSQIYFLRGEELAAGRFHKYDALLALDKYNLAIQWNEKFIEAYISKSEILFKLDMLEEMNNCLEQAITINRNNIKIWILKGKMLIQQHKCEQALDCLNQASQLNLNNNGTSKDLEQFFQNQEHSNLVIKCIDRYISMKMNDPWGMKKKVEILKSFQEYTKAILYCDLFIQYNPDQIDGYEVKANILESRNDYEKAIQCWDKYILQKPSDLNGYFEKSQLFSDKLKGIECWDQYIFYNESTKSLGFDFKAKELKQMNENEKAIQCLDQCILNNPHNVCWYYDKAKILSDMDEQQKAIECWDQFILLNPEDYTGYKEKAKLLEKRNQPEKASQCLDQYILKNPEDFYQQGIILENRNENEKAIECWGKYILQKPYAEHGYQSKCIQAVILIAKLLEKRNQFQKAIECWDYYIFLNPHEQTGYLKKFCMLNLLDDFDGAIECLDQWCFCFPENYCLLFVKSDLLLKIKEKEKAFKFLDQIFFFQQQYKNQNQDITYFYKSELLWDLQQYQKAIQCRRLSFSLSTWELAQFIQFV